MQRQSITALTIVACVTFSILLGIFIPRDNSLDGWFFDTALWARNSQVSGAGARDDVVVLALDQRSLDAPELRNLPRALFSPIWAETLNGLGQADAAAVAFDFLLSFSSGQFKAGHDREFQKALFRYGDRVVLGRSAGTLPAKSYLAALRFDPTALGLLELLPDTDGVIREFPLSHGDKNAGDDVAVRSLSAAALAKAGIGQALPPRIIPSPRQHPEAMPTYALVDVLRCMRTAPDVVKKTFEGLLVFIGSVLPDEDRRISAARYLPPANPIDSNSMKGCQLPRLGPSKANSHTVPGVYLHAMAAQAAISGNWVRPAAPLWRAVIAAALGLAGALLGLFLAPWGAFLCVFILAGLVWSAEAGALEFGLWLPAFAPILALFLTTVLAYLVRYLVSDRRRRMIQNAFGRYLAPSVVEALSESPDQLRLGGTLGDVTVMFADLSGFTALSTRTSPEELVTLTNEYLAIIADEVDASNGYVDKFIGDAVMAIWGAPIKSDQHAMEASRAALRIVDEIAKAGEAAKARGAHSFGIKIGIQSGPAIVGNVGSARRYNYTAVGETVNIAARLEGLPGVYGCSLLLGPSTAAAVGEMILLREIDHVAVKGREAPLTIFEPLGLVDAITAAQSKSNEDFSSALAHYRARRFQQAADLWRAMGDGDGPAQLMAARAELYIATPPANDWDGVFVMTGK